MNHLTDTGAEIASEQGWNEESIIIHLMGFIRSQDLTDNLDIYLERVAFEEKREGSQ